MLGWPGGNQQKYWIRGICRIGDNDRCGVIADDAPFIRVCGKVAILQQLLSNSFRILNYLDIIDKNLSLI
ncbi:hypothetical protein ES703_112312 [subsurface metagenome]